MEQVKKTFKPEFLNRLDEIITFHPLNGEHLMKIADIELAAVKDRMEEQHIRIVVSDKAKKFQ